MQHVANEESNEVAIQTDQNDQQDQQQEQEPDEESNHQDTQWKPSV